MKNGTRVLTPLGEGVVIVQPGEWDVWGKRIDKWWGVVITGGLVDPLCDGKVPWMMERDEMRAI